MIFDSVSGRRIPILPTFLIPPTGLPIFNNYDQVDMVISLFDFTTKYQKEELESKGRSLKSVTAEINKKIRGFESNNG
jgi:hypothetical protein